MTDEFYMQLAIDEAWKYQLLTYPNPAVGATVVCDGRILAVAAHQRAGTSHAEVLALIGAYESITGHVVEFDRFDAVAAHEFLSDLPRGFFAKCTVYVTLEPCIHKGRTPSCAVLMSQLHLERVVVGVADPVEGHGGGASLLPNVTMGVLADECQALIEPFVIWQKRAFVLLKLAQTTNGCIGGGYLSSQASLRHVHQMRAVSDKILIGGNTVRVDRPRIDCRFVDGEAPDVVIYSKNSEFDTTIPLFGIDGRDVTVTDDLSWLEKPSFVIVEGGESMVKALRDRVDWFLVYQTPKLTSDQLSYNVDIKLQFLYTDAKGVDIMIWSKNLGY